MCEIAVLDPSRYSSSELKSAAVTLYDSMRSSLGVVAVKENEDRTKFEYDTYKAVVPDKEVLLEFIEETKEESVRIIIHGRMATHGAVTVEHSHPLEINCDECNVDYLIHNGVVPGFEYERGQLTNEGHNFTTEVDSELIAHDFGEVPNQFEGFEDLYHREPGFLLLNEDRIFIHASRYQLTNDARMAHGHRDFGPDRREKNFFRVLYYPEESEDI